METHQLRDLQFHPENRSEWTSLCEVGTSSLVKSVSALVRWNITGFSERWASNFLRWYLYIYIFIICTYASLHAYLHHSTSRIYVLVFVVWSILIPMMISGIGHIMWIRVRICLSEESKWEGLNLEVTTWSLKKWHDKNSNLWVLVILKTVESLQQMIFTWNCWWFRDFCPTSSDFTASEFLANQSRLVDWLWYW